MYAKLPNIKIIYFFTGIWCILTVWPIFQSSRHWTTLCCELLLF